MLVKLAIKTQRRQRVLNKIVVSNANSMVISDYRQETSNFIGPRIRRVRLVDCRQDCGSCLAA